MKSIVSELEKSIEEIKVEEGRVELIKGSKSREALVLLVQAIKTNGYDPSEITMKKTRVLLLKKEVTVRFSLQPKGFILVKVPKGYCEREAPTVLVHIKEEGSYINTSMLSKALKILVSPYYWERGKR